MRLGQAVFVLIAGVTCAGLASGASLVPSTNFISFSGNAGQSCPSCTATVTVTASPSSPALHFSAVASPNGSWLSVTPNQATTTATLTVSANLSSLPAGNYSGTITLTCDQGSSCPTFTIQVTLSASGIVLTATPDPVTVSVTAGQATIANVTLTGAGGGTQVFATVVAGNSWLQASVPNPNTLSLVISATNLTPGNLSGAVQLQCQGGSPCAPVTESVNLLVTASQTQNSQIISHIADGGGWRSILLLTNTDKVAAPYTVSFRNDAGSSYLPSLATGASSGTIPVGGSTIVGTGDAASTLSEGWAQITSSQSINGTAIFRYDPWSQEAAVPLLTSGGTKLEIPYQIGNGLSLGVALANTNATQTANITEVIRDQNGNQLSSRTLTPLGPLNHTAFNPTFPAGATVGGLVEYDSSVSIYGLGIRSSPVGTGLAFTSVDAVVAQPASTKTISHIADGGGWRSIIVLVNTDTVPAQYTVNFLTDTGAAYVPALTSGTASGTIPVGGSTIIETADAASALTEGWAQVMSSQAIGGTAIFRYDPWSQEAAVPLLTGGGMELEIPYQVGSGLALGVALANPSSTQMADITEVIRDANGNQLSSRTLTLAPLSHTAFNPTFPSNATAGGVVEYDSNTALYALGIRSAPEGSGLAFTSEPAAYK